MSAKTLMPAERQKEILQRIQKDGRVLATDLAQEFQTSEDTIRRALRDLAAQGRCTRVYGGALAMSAASGSALERRKESAERKFALGKEMAPMVRSGQLLFIDAGSTNLAAARSLPEELRRMTDAIASYIYVFRPDGTALYANQAVLDYIGLTLEDVQREDQRARVFHPEDVERLREERHEALARGKPFELEQRALGKDGNYRWFLVRFNPLRDDHGNFIR